VSSDDRTIAVTVDDVVQAPELSARRSRGRWLVSGLLGRGGWFYVLAIGAVSAFNFVFHVAMSRLLGPGHYGALGAILNLIMILAVPLGAIQLAVTQGVVARIKSGGASLRTLVVKSIGSGLVATAVFWAVTPLLDSFLDLKSPVPLLVLGLWLPLGIMGAVVQGALIGEFRFVPVAVATVLGGGFLRLAVGTALVLAGLGLVGAVAATVIGQAVTTGMLLVVTRKEIRLVSDDPVRITLRDATLSIAALAALTTFTGIDTILARHFLDPVPAGLYAAAAVAGHIAMFLPGALVMVVFPRLVADGGVGPQSRKALAEAFWLMTVIGLGATVVLAGVPRLVVRLLFGAAYAHAAEAVGVLALASALFGLITLLTYFHIARRSLVALMSWAGVILATVLIAIFHGGIEAIALSMLVVSVVVLPLSLVPAARALLRAMSEEGARIIEPLELPDPEVDLTLVVPFYNPGECLGTHVGEIVETLRAEAMTFEIVAVSDGSTDGSEAMLADREHVRVLRLPKNQGKGAALRLGLMQGRGRYLGFMDGDGDLPASQLKDFIAAIRDTKPDIVLGSKLHPDSEVVYPQLRHLYSFIYQQLNRVLFGLSIRDTQTGVKLIRRDVLTATLPRMLEKRFAFDLELLVVARRVGYRHFVELPVKIRERFSSTISWKTVYNLLVDTAAIFYRLKVLRYYGPPQTVPTAGTDEPLVAQVDSPAPVEPPSPGLPLSSEPELLTELAH
jgi:O-antigen/teichoic acid export membrane protein